MTFSDVQNEALAFRDEREWKQFHNPKDLAISISLEAAELLECFQWSGADLDPSESKQHVREELADVMMYCIMLRPLRHWMMRSMISILAVESVVCSRALL